MTATTLPNRRSPELSLHLQRIAFIVAAAWTVVIALGVGWHLLKEGRPIMLRIAHHDIERLLHRH